MVIGGAIGLETVGELLDAAVVDTLGPLVELGEAIGLMDGVELGGISVPDTLAEPEAEPDGGIMVDPGDDTD